MSMQTPYRKPGKYTNISPDYLITKEKYQKLQSTLKTLKKEKPEAAKEVMRLAELGDFSENVEYQLAKRKLRRINNKILKLEQRINRAEIIESSSTNIIEIGSKVTISIDNKEKIYTILGSSESNPAKGIVSYSSPIGQILVGKKKGQTFTAQIGPSEKKITIINIS